MLKNLKKIKPETIFIFIGVLLLAFVVTVVVYAINFLVSEMKITLGQEGQGLQEITRFNLEGLKKIGLVSEGQPELPSGGEITTTTQIATSTQITTTTQETGTTTGRIATTTESTTTPKSR